MDVIALLYVLAEHFRIAQYKEERGGESEGVTPDLGSTGTLLRMPNGTLAYGHMNVK